MPGPPPPPPGMMPPAPPPPAAFSKAGKADDRSALLKSIQKGTTLRKTVTNDRSAPAIGKVVSNNNSNSSSPSSVGGTPTANGLNLGGLFAGGMPRLKPTGKLGVPNQNSSDNAHSNNNNDRSIHRKQALPAQPIKSPNSLQNELKKQMASDSRNRGPPPPAPVRSMVEENGTQQPPPSKVGSTNGLHVHPSPRHSNVQPQNSTLHRRFKSNVNSSTVDGLNYSARDFNQTSSKPVISHGKPNLAPKPPLMNAKPVAPPKRYVLNGKPVSRAHSMRIPRSPSPQSPDIAQVKFGTVKNLSSAINHSLANATATLIPRVRPTLNGRPSGPPPSIPSQQTPPPPPPHASPVSLPLSKAGVVKPPNHAPPPPPSMLPHPPNHTPPPPPQRAYPSRAPPAVPQFHFAPPPPPRNSSMTSTRKMDLEERYRKEFRDPSAFPRPPPYKHIFKFYGSRQAVSKQQAPQPPNSQATSRAWDAPQASC